MKKTARGNNFHIEFKNGSQKLAWATFQQHEVLFLLGPAGTGKALTLDSKLYTRTGSIRMGDVKLGDEIANPDGGFSRVIGVFPQGKKQICRVHFSDFTYVDCCEDHLWQVSHSDNGWKDKVVDTKYLEMNCRRKKDGKKRVLSIDCPKPVEFEKQDFLIEPYVLGILLAEGCLTDPNVVFTTCESQILERVESSIGENYSCRSSDALDYRIVKTKRSNKTNVYKDELKLLGLWGKKSFEKHIPDQYLYGSVSQRVDLLRGLMDGDGGVEYRSSSSFSTTSQQMAEDFCQLVFSLGGTTRIKTKKGALKLDGSRYRVSYRCYVNLPNNIQPFWLNRKKNKTEKRTKYFPKKYVDRVERMGFCEMQCISVDHEKQLYLTDNFITTHNTFLGCAFAVESLLTKKHKKIVMTRPIVDAGEKLGFLPGEFENKVGPYMIPMHDAIDRLVGPEGPQHDRIAQSIETCPLAFMRGRNFYDAICILDEAQNCTRTQLKLFLTRPADNSKLIITGDPSQSDLFDNGRSDLMKVVQDLKGVEGVGVIEFNSDSIVRSALVARIVEKLK